MRRLFAILLSALTLCTAAPASSVAAATENLSTPKEPQCSPGRKTEHFPTVDIWDVIRILAADYDIKLQPALSLQHQNIDTDLVCYSRPQAIAYLEGMGLRLVRVGPSKETVYMVYPAADAMKISGKMRYFQLTHIAVDDSVVQEVKDALPENAYVAKQAQSNGILVSGTGLVLSRAAQIIATIDRAHGSIISKTYSVTSGMSADTVVQKLTPYLPANTLVANNSDNSILISGPADVVAQAQDMLSKYDVAGYQVSLGFKIVALYPQNDSSSVGIRVGGVDANGNETPGSGSTVALIPGFTLHGNVAVDLNITHGVVDVRDEPTLTVRNNETATLNDATRYPYTYYDVLGQSHSDDTLIGLVVKATPTISGDGKTVTVAIDATDSEFGGYTPQLRVISVTREGTTTLTTRDGVPIAILDLQENMNNYSIQKVPWLGDIPLLGSLFRYKQSQRREGRFALLITPHVQRLAQ